MSHLKMFTLENVSVSYENKAVIRSLSLHVENDSFVSLIGPNGSGKTTLLKTLAGLLNYSGSVRLNGLELRDITRKTLSRSVGFAMSAKNFHPSSAFTVQEVIAMGRLPHLGMFASLSHSDMDTINHSASLLGITDILNHNILTLSDGQRQLALLAATLATNTPVLLLDEPTSSLDPDKTASVFHLLHSLANSGRTIIAAVHDINASLHYSHSYIAIKNGVLISHGYTTKLTSSVLNELYGCEFVDYMYKEGHDVLWRALPKKYHCGEYACC